MIDSQMSVRSILNKFYMLKAFKRAIYHEDFPIYITQAYKLHFTKIVNRKRNVCHLKKVGEIDNVN